jgi:hypothetical protein
MTAITITVVFGGGDARPSVQPFVVELRNRMRTFAEVRRSSAIDSFDLKLFVSGDIDEFTGDGSLDKPRVLEKKRVASGEITMQETTWRAGERAVKMFLRDRVRAALDELAGRVAEKGLPIDAPGLLADFDAATADWVR